MLTDQIGMIHNVNFNVSQSWRRILADCVNQEISIVLKIKNRNQPDDTMKKLHLLTIFIFSTVFTITFANAHEKVVVLPLNFSHHSSKNLENIVTVSKKGGNFADPVEAVKSITDATENKPYLVLIGPGIFELSEALQLKSYVTIQGAGESATKLSAGFGDTANGNEGAVVLGADNSVICNLCIENTGPSQRSNTSVAIYNNNSSPTIYNVTTRVSSDTPSIINVSNTNNSSPAMSNVTIISTGRGSAASCGLSNDNSSPTLKNVTITTQGGASNCGIVNYYSSLNASNIEIATRGEGVINCGISSDNSTLTIQNATVDVTGPGTVQGCLGLSNNTSSATVMNATINVSGAATNRGIANTHSTLELQRGIISSTSGNNENVGVKNNDNSIISIYHSKVEGESSAIIIEDGANNKIIQSSIIGGASYSGGNGVITCLSSDNGMDKELELNCSESTTSP